MSIISILYYFFRVQNKLFMYIIIYSLINITISNTNSIARRVGDAIMSHVTMPPHHPPPLPGHYTMQQRSKKGALP